MSLINSTAIPSGVATGYQIANSARFNGTTTKLTRTPSSSGNRRMLTFSAWIKQGDVGTSINGNAFFSAGVNGDKFAYQSGSLFRTTGYKSSAYWGMRDWNGIQRDSGGWKHIVVRFDTAQGTEANRSRLFINGVEATQNYKYYDITQNYDMRYNHTADAHWLGAMNNGSYFDGYMAEVHWIDGAIVSPNAFGEVGDYGEWKPKEYVPGDYAAYGTNGYYLNFADSSHFGKDVSGNGNNWTDTGFDTGDQVVDSPTNNFATMNPISTIGTYSEGNLEVLTTVSGSVPYNQMHYGTFAMTSGKWYFECLVKDISGLLAIGISSTESINRNRHNNLGSNGVNSYLEDGRVYTEDTEETAPDTYGVGDIISVAYDMDANKIYFAKNNAWQSNGTGAGNPATAANPYTIDTLAGCGQAPIITNDNTSNEVSGIFNFGQDSSFASNKTAQGNQDGNSIGDFYYTPPTGFLALCTSNLPDVAVVPSEHFNTVLYTGTDATNSTHAISGIGFSPSFVWTKDRDATYGHYLFDAVRGTGVTKGLRSNSTAVEGMANQSYDALSSFDSDGFTITGAAFGSLYQDRNNADYVSWNWKANGSGASNTTGSINTTKTSANVDAGFSMVTYTGNATSGATLGHGLSKAPELMFVKRRNVAGGWMTYSAATGATKTFTLNSTEPAYTSSGIWNNTAPSSSLITIGNNGAVNTNGGTYIAYCFHSVEGYSKVGSYKGNANADGSFVYTGFRPAWLLVKRTDDNGNWYTWDSKRGSYNVIGNRLYMDGTGAEATTPLAVDFTSNGFKWRDTNGGWNTSGDYIYLAFAETPFKYSNAR